MLIATRRIVWTWYLEGRQCSSSISSLVAHAFQQPHRTVESYLLGHYLKEGGTEQRACVSFVWQERAHTCVTQMTHMPSLKLLFFLQCQNQGSLCHRCVICLTQRKKRTTPPMKTPMKVSRERTPPLGDAQSRRKKYLTHECPTDSAHESAHTECPRESAHESTHDDFPCFQSFKDSQRKLPLNIPRRRLQKCQLKWSRFICSVFLCSVPRPSTMFSMDLPNETSPSALHANSKNEPLRYHFELHAPS